MTEASGLELETDRAFQRRFWRIQRVGWIAMALILIVALLGLTGKGGPLARASVAGPGGEIVYPRVARWEATDEIEIRLAAAAAPSTTVEIGSAFGRIFQIEDIQPAPSSSIATSAGQELTFDLGPGEGEKTVTIHVRPLQPELSTSIPVRIGNGAPLAIAPVVLP